MNKKDEDKNIVSNLCQHCEEKPAETPHPCPFKEDIHGDSETLCNCCHSCRHECYMNI